MKNFTEKILESWINTEGNVNTTEEIYEWIDCLNKNTYVDVSECSINESTFWFYDDYNGEILNRKQSFFSVKGMRMFEDGHFIKEQPIIVQPEIGYLGIICKEIDGVINFLMQAKIEPGNINCVQISPTIQATKSNFTRAHGGNYPAYLEYFENASKFNVVYDQIQSEQASRFYRKRNRNMILEVDAEIEVLSNFRWMTLGQIKKLMKVDNLVNMDTRTVLSGIPLIGEVLNESDRTGLSVFFADKTLYRSIFATNPLKSVTPIYQKINTYKMFHDVKVSVVPLNQLIGWEVSEYGIVCQNSADFMVKFYNIEIEGREVQQWIQPLFKAIGKAIFGIIIKNCCGVKKFLVRMKSEIGLMDKVELGPSVQFEPTHKKENDNIVESVFRKYLSDNNGVAVDVILSEEGGRFYHEENRNVIIEVPEEELTDIPDDYLWVDYSALNYLIQVNNCLNIQLRNLLSLITI